MNHIILGLFTIIFTMGCSSGKKVVERIHTVDLLSLDSNTLIEPLLEDVKKEFKKDYIWGKQVFILRIEHLDDGKLEVGISVYDVSDFTNCFEAKLFPLYGLFKYGEHRVLVYGNDSRILFHKKGIKEEVNFLNCKEKKGVHLNYDTPYPPVTFEPIVWIYEGDVEKLIFREKAQFNLIE